MRNKDVLYTSKKISKRENYQNYRRRFIYPCKKRSENVTAGDYFEKRNCIWYDYFD